MGLTVLDAGILIAALDGNGAHHASAARTLRAAQPRGDDLVIPASAYAEILVRPAERGPATVERVDAALDALGISIESADRPIARRAAELRAKQRNLRLPDALVIATAIQLDADRLVTTDKSWRSPRDLGFPGRMVRVP